ncbi:SIR2 family NAD-dependent protein deacylase [Coraliomargarita parva]|uniref:SIR2 family NAD-dependent protein deacylase n=1 Tax=Coraliomargarita parva TaxID=3014050 RepID=UPI0022B526D3|nr:NAD-dependent deacylase [Coraliomargarita parva]
MTPFNHSKHIVVLTGAGVSAESGLKTFRDAGGLWEGFRVEDVATPEAWKAHPQRVLDFYNMRRRQLYEVEPNPAHLALARLEQSFRVSIITQNVDNLHERAGSTQVLHLHGELDYARSTADETLVYPLEGKDIRMGDTCELGSQLRPHIVWFGEMVPAMETAASITSTADILIVIGTSLIVYPAASLAYLAPTTAAKFLVNPEIPEEARRYDFEFLEAKAATAIPELVKRLCTQNK